MPIIQVNTAASGLDIFLRDGAGNLTDPTTITYDIAEPGLTLVADDVAGFKRSTGHFDARSTVIPSGFSTALPWKITWTFTSAGGVTSSKTEEFCVVSELSASFTNAENLFELVKIDIDENTLTNPQLEKFLTKTLDWLNFKLRLTGTGGELSFDGSKGEILPAPNSTIFSFIIMRMECLIVKRRQASAVGTGIKVRDGDSQIDTTASFAGHKTVVRDVCGELDKCIERYLDDLSQGVFGDGGAANNGDLIWHGNQRIIEDTDHDGQSFGTRDFRSPFDDHLGHFVNSGADC